jgi:hypothetical protein
MKKNGVGKVEVRGAAAEMTREVVFRPPGASLDARLGTLSIDEQGNGKLKAKSGFPLR